MEGQIWTEIPITLVDWWVDGKVTAQSRGFHLKICPYWFFGRGFGPKAGVGSPPAFGLTVQFLLFVKAQ